MTRRNVEILSHARSNKRGAGMSGTFSERRRRARNLCGGSLMIYGANWPALMPIAVIEDKRDLLLFDERSAMLIRYAELADGPGPSEKLVKILTVDGSFEEVVVSRRQAENGLIKVGHPIATGRDRYLVELPRESMSGLWRVWVPESEIVGPEIRAAE